jgi:autotransporter translocation and assembly factor TamB
MRTLRRLLQVVALVGTLIVGVVAMSLIVSQTPWFRDWLRRYIVRESKQYLNGELAIGGLGGNLLFGVDLSDIAVDVSGERVIAVKTVELDYSVFELISSGIVLDEIKLTQPVVRAERDGNGWNLGRLVKRQEKEADREGPRRPISLPAIEIRDARVTIDDSQAPGGYRLPGRIEGLDVKAGFEYEAVHYTVDLDHVSFRGTAPELTLQELTGKIAVRDDNVYIDGLTVKTTETSVTIDGVIEHYLKTPVLKLTTTGNLSLPEIGRVVPAAAGYGLHPAIDVKANGPADRLALDLDVTSEAGSVRGQITADVKAPDRRVQGEVDVQGLNLAPILKQPDQRTNITGHARIDLRLPSRPASVPMAQRMSGTFTFAGPHVVAAGYEARNVHATGSLDGRRITLDARAAAYGGMGTARGFVLLPAAGAPIEYDLRGRAGSVDLRDLPDATGAPKIETDLSVSAYRVRGEGRTVSGSATLSRSTVEGATIADGTVADFSVTPRAVTYSARGQAADVDLQRFGKAFEITALATPEYQSRINTTFDVKGVVDRTAPRGGRRGAAPSTLSTMTLDATGTLTDSNVLGGRVDGLDVDAHLDRGALGVRANGQFEGFDPGRLLRRENLAGDVSGTVNANVSFTDLTAPITPESVTADGTLALTSSTIGGLKIDTADVEGRYASQIGDITRLTITGPDVKAIASGRLSLDRTSTSNLKYHVEAINLNALGRLAGQNEIGGAAIVDGTVTGNAASLTATGTLDGSNLSYQKNNALDLNSRYTVTIPDLQFAAAHVQSATAATFVSAAGLEISQLTATTTYHRQRLEFTTHIKERTRELDATGQVIFHPDHQELHLPALVVRTQGIEWRTAPGSEPAIQYGRGRIDLEDVRLVSADQSLDVSGTLALQGAATSGSLDVKARNVDLQQLETLLLQDRGFSGRLTADVTVGGSTADPVIDGRVQVSNGAFKTYKYESLDATVKYGGPRLQLNATLQQSPTESITAQGSVPMSLFERREGAHVAPGGEDQIDLQVTSTQINLGLVQAFTGQVTNVTGTMQADVTVTGSGLDPHLDGYIDIKNGAFGVPLGGVSYSGLNTRIELDPDRVRLQEFQILDEHGKPLTVSGELAVHERHVGDINITLTSRDFEVIDNELGDLGVDVQLRLTGELRRPRLVGDVRLEEGRVEVDRILQQFHDPYSVESLPDVVSAERTVEGSGSAQQATQEALKRAEVSAAAPGAGRAPADLPPARGGVMDLVELDVQLRIPENLVLRGQDLRPGGPTGTAIGDMNITVGGDIRVRKAAGGRITLTGTVETVRGTYEFQGRRFDLVRGGMLRFVGAPEINPLIDISATRRIPNTGVEARIRVTGTARAPELALSSNPSLEESDILSLIVFNRPINELGTGERSSLAATAGGIATGFLAAPLGESIGKALDLDLFEITTTTETGYLGAGVTLGHQIWDRAFIKLHQTFGERNVSEFMLEYQLADFLRLQATAAPETSGSGNRLSQRRVERAGIDLIFFFSY